MQTPDMPATDSTSPASAPSRRLGSIDAFRGLVMLLMLGEGLHLCSVARALPESGFWKLLCHHQSHVPWVGCALHDLIQPSFSFLVGTAMVSSIASRTARGSAFGGMFGHAVWRALVLIRLWMYRRKLFLNYESPLFRPGNSQTLLVSVHAGDSMEGLVVASSEPLSFDRSIDPRGPGFVEFPFPEPVPLNPGMPYTLDVSYVAGDEILALAIIPGGDQDTYPPGWMYMAGAPALGTSWSADLWFRTGTVIPEPGTAALLVIGGALLLAGRARRRRSGKG